MGWRWRRDSGQATALVTYVSAVPPEKSQSWRREKGRRASGTVAVHTRIMDPTHAGWARTMCAQGVVGVGGGGWGEDTQEE